MKWRLVWFRERHPHGVITTEEVCVDVAQGYARFKATVWDGEGGIATGYGTETAAGFADYVERAETRALGRALAALGIGTQFVGQDLTEGEHVADAPVARPENRELASFLETDGQGNIQRVFRQQESENSIDQPKNDLAPEASRISRDEARTLKQLAQHAFGYGLGERRLRADLGFEPEESLTLRHLAAHVSAAQYATLRAAYEAHLQAVVEADVP